MKLKLATKLSEQVSRLSQCVDTTRATWARTCWLALGVLLAASIQPGRSEAQAVPGAHYQVRMSDYYGQLKNTGYTPLRFTITRFGPAVNVAETVYAGVDVSGIGYNGSREFPAKVDFSAGQVSATVEVNVAFSTGYGRHAVVSRDGSTSMVPRRSLLATIYLPEWLTRVNFGANANSVTESVGIAYFTSQMVLDTGVHIDTYSNPSWSDKPSIQTGPSVAANVTAAIPNLEEFSKATGNVAKRLAHSNIAFPTVSDPQLNAALTNRFVVAGDFSAIPETWLGLSRVDVCLMSAEDLRLLANRQPEKLEVIRQWVVAGGRLVILNCQADFRALGSIVPNLKSASKSTEELGTTQWMMLEDASANDFLRQYNSTISSWTSEIAARNNLQPWQITTFDNPINTWIYDQSLAKKTRTFLGPAAKVAQEAAAANASCLSSVFGLGRIVAVPSDGAAMKQLDWVKLLVLVLGNQEASCFEGIGGSNHQFSGYAGFDYKRLGKPPWLLFLVMITLFAVLVGPVAFVILTRMQRTHFLLGAVPLVAGVITFGIVGYAMIQDGFAFRTSRFSVTWLDTTHQTALTQTTQMVYSGLAPGSLRVPRTTAYYDNSFDPTRYRYNQMRLSLQGDQQIISGTKIQARTKFQVTTFDVQAAGGQVLLSVSDDGSKWEATNELGFDVVRLVIQTPAGPMMAENVGVGATAVLERDSRVKSQWFNELGRQDQEGQAAIPELLRDNTNFGQGDRLSRACASVLDSRQISPGMFLAISKQQPLARNLRENAFQDEELHVTIGQFRATTRVPDTVPPSGRTDSSDDEISDDHSESASNVAGDE